MGGMNYSGLKFKYEEREKAFKLSNAKRYRKGVYEAEKRIWIDDEKHRREIVRSKSIFRDKDGSRKIRLTSGLMSICCSLGTRDRHLQRRLLGNSINKSIFPLTGSWVDFNVFKGLERLGFDDRQWENYLEMKAWWMEIQQLETEEDWLGWHKDVLDPRLKKAWKKFNGGYV